MSITLSAADLAALAAPGGTLTIIGPNPAATAPPPVITPPVTPPATNSAPALKTIMAQNGKTPQLPQDYSYDCTNVRDFPGGNGNPNCIKVTTTGAWGGFQPSSNNGQSISFASSSRITCDVSAPKGTSFSFQFLMGGDEPILDANGNGTSFEFTKTKDGWETFSCAKSLVMTDAKLGDVSTTIYKGAVQYKGTDVGFVFLVDNWGGV